MLAYERSPDIAHLQLEPVPAPAPRRAPTDAAELVQQVELHHGYARRALPYIVSLLARVAGFHGRRNAKLEALCDTGQALSDRLEALLEEEELALFPALRGGATREVLHGELRRMFRRHRELGLLFTRLRALADDYTTPAWADCSYRVLMEELEALEEDVGELIHLENYVLAPRLFAPVG
jgi:regulator of cell morphogenesis and NO signaling